ncbi:phosphoserine phosphatase SerB [Thalassotalea marina]|uniref:Phosphoserine phosphatase n=1 Tax=Thalassotalea marina TaxID=1673741 RepID=A0A919BFS6_9GAMM|nr:phosphoserine phosphatase SerB [Thalassotalea marina]GHF85988.1 hypothetical protein GCM10017161_12030 [Thalassotalea marina]
MTDTFTKLSAVKNADLSLAHVFTSKTQHLPAYCQIASSFLVFNAALSQLAGEKTEVQNVPSLSSSLELVVFDNLTLQHLVQIIDICHLEIIALSAINERNQRTSYRFAAVTENLEKSNQSLIEYCQQHQLEAALINNAPKLTTPGLLVMDMDSTTIQIECIDEIATLAGVGEQVSEVTERAMLGELDFSESLYQRVATLNGASETVLSQVASDIPLMPGLKVLLAELKAHQWKVAIASGGFTYFADHLKQLLDLDAAVANELEIIDGKLTGKVLGRVVDAQIKAQTLTELAQKYGISHQQTVAMGDGANDLAMMHSAHLGVAFHAKPIVQKQADSAINTSGLDLLLHWLA